MPIDPIEVKKCLMVTSSLSAAERECQGEGWDFEEAQDAVQDAAVELIADAPRELRNSFETVCAWHRWNAIFKAAANKEDASAMMKAQAAMDALLAGVH